MCRPSDSGFYVVDRCEEGIFVLVGDGGGKIETDSLPCGAREGSVLRHDGTDWVLCPGEEAARRARIAGKKRRIFRRSDQNHF